MNSFTDLDAWKIGIELILANLAEGFGRASKADKAYKYTIARGECSETHALLLVSVELNKTNKEKAKYGIELAIREGRVFSGLIRAYTTSKTSSEPES